MFSTKLSASTLHTTTSLLVVDCFVVVVVATETARASFSGRTRPRRRRSATPLASGEHVAVPDEGTLDHRLTCHGVKRPEAERRVALEGTPVRRQEVLAAETDARRLVDVVGVTTGDRLLARRKVGKDRLRRDDGRRRRRL